MAFFNRKKDNEPKMTEETKAPQAVSVALPKGEDGDAYGVIVAPIVTEKASLLSSQGTYVFKIAKDANKIQVKEAIQVLYKVKVDRVRILHTSSKSRIMGRYRGEKSGYKKAYVTLKKGETISFTN